MSDSSPSLNFDGLCLTREDDLELQVEILMAERRALERECERLRECFERARLLAHKFHQAIAAIQSCDIQAILNSLDAE